MKTTINILIIAVFIIASCSRGFYATSTEYDDVYYIPGKKSEPVYTTEQGGASGASVNNEAVSPDAVRKSTAIPYDSSADGLSDYERYRLQKEQEAVTGSEPVYRSETEYNYDSSVVYEDETVQDNADSYSYYDENTDRIVINNYYGEGAYNDYDYYYSSRIRRFSNPYSSWNYYDPFYTDMFHYNYNPAYWGMSIYQGSYFSPYFGFSYSPWSYGGYYPYSSWRHYDPWYSPFYHNSYYRGYGMG